MMNNRAFSLLSKATLVAVAASAASAFAVDFTAADAAFAKRTDAAQAEQARKLYKEALTTASGDEKLYAVEQLGRLDYYEGNSTSDNESQKRIFGHCLDAVESIKSTAASKPHYNYWRALCLASWAKANGVLKSLEKAGELVDLIEKGRKVDETYEGGGFYRIGAATYLNLPPLFGGDIEKAWSYAQKAISSPAYSGAKNPDTETGNYQYAIYLYAAQIAAKREGKAAAKAIAQDAIDRIEAGDIPEGREPETEIQAKDLREYIKSLN